MAGVRLPLESFPLQALVSEPVKPVLPCVVMSNAVHAYISQSDKGELVIGAGTDAVHVLQPARRPARHRAHARRDLRAVPDVLAACGCCATGAASSTSRPTARRSSARRRCRASTSIAAGAPAASRRRRAPAMSSPHTIAHGRAAPDQRAVHARALPHRRADRRGGRRRRGALRAPHAADPLSLLRRRAPEIEFRYGGEAHIARPADPADARRRGLGATTCIMRTNPQGPARRALAPRPRLPPLVQRRARHRQRPHPDAPTRMGEPRPTSTRASGARR